MLVLVVILGMVLITACGENANNDNEGNNNENNESASNEDENNNENEETSNNENTEDQDKPTITMMITLHTSEVPGDKILDLVEEATNVELDIEWVPDN